MRENDRVVIKLGPTRYDSDKAMRSKLEDAKDEATNDAFNSIVNDPNLDLGAGTETLQPTVDPFGIPRAYISADFPLETQQNVPFDVTARANTGGLASNIDTTTTNNDTFAYDMAGLLTIGADTIIGPNNARGSVTGVNAFTRSSYQASVTNKALTTNVATLTVGTHLFQVGDSIKVADVDATFNGNHIISAKTTTTISYPKTAADVPSASSSGTVTRFTGTNASLFASAAAQSIEYYIQKTSGRIFSPNSTNTPANTIAHRAVGDALWTTTSLTTPTGYAYDPQSGWFWYMRDPSGVPNLSYISPSTTTFAAEAAYDLPTSAGWLDNSFIAGHNYLAVLNTSTGTFYRKASNSTANFTALTTYTTANFNPGTANIRRVQISPAGNLSYIYSDGITGTLHLRELKSSGMITDIDLSLDTSLVQYCNHMYLANGKLVIMISADDSFFGFAGGYQMLGIIVFDGISSTIVYYDAVNVSDPTLLSGGIRMSRPIEVEANKIRFGAYSDISSGAGDDYTYHYELTIT
jgi:hypothetical protein